MHTVNNMQMHTVHPRSATHVSVSASQSPSAKKAFLRGINGCVDHNQVLHEIIRHAKSNSRTLHVTWFDLEDAFGSVPHELIHYSLARCNIHPTVRLYIQNMYSNLSGRVRTKNWTSDYFDFKNGIFQGDSLSPIIFLLCFNPIVQYLESELSHGYLVQDTKIITTPFADDFSLITSNKRTHQRIITTIRSHTLSLGLKLKSSKCRSLSISRGKALNIPFKLGSDIISSVEDESHKFLGSLITFRNKEGDVFDYYLLKLISKGLTNIDSSPIRSEFKLRIFNSYFMPGIRFHLAVNDVCASHLDRLDDVVKRYVKQWLGIPHPGTLAFAFMPNGLDIMSPSRLYREAHLSAHIFKDEGGPLVNACIDSRVERESDWIRKKSIAMDCENIFNATNSPDCNSYKQLQTTAKKSLSQQVQDHWDLHVRGLIVQGRFLELMSLEESCHHWKSIAYNLPAGVLKFLVNSVGDTLNTRVNLVRWG